VQVRHATSEKRQLLGRQRRIQFNDAEVTRQTGRTDGRLESKPKSKGRIVPIAAAHSFDTRSSRANSVRLLNAKIDSSACRYRGRGDGGARAGRELGEDMVAVWSSATVTRTMVNTRTQRTKKDGGRLCETDGRGRERTRKHEQLCNTHERKRSKYHFSIPGKQRPPSASPHRAHRRYGWCPFFFLIFHFSVRVLPASVSGPNGAERIAVPEGDERVACTAGV
jgi:hypothetical protein